MGEAAATTEIIANLLGLAVEKHSAGFELNQVAHTDLRLIINNVPVHTPHLSLI